jgi:hypothetical protein
MTFAQFIPSIFGAMLGFAIKYCYDIYSQRRKFKKELEDNNHVEVTGEWYAAWETSIDGHPLTNTEHVQIVQKGKTLKMWNTERSPENPKGAYLWNAQLQFFQGRNAMGWFLAKPEERNTSKGIMYFCYFSQRKIFYGQWVGTAYDGELVCGFAVIAKDRTGARTELETFIARHPREVLLISYDGLAISNPPERAQIAKSSPE